MGESKRRPKGITRNDREKNQGWNATVIAASITAFTAVVVALFSFPPFIALFQKSPTSTVTLTVTVTDTLIPATATDFFLPTTTESNTPTSTATEMPSSTATYTHIPTLTSSATNTATPTASTTPGLPVGMDVQLVADQTSGRHPLTVDFDAGDSFFRDANGVIYPCGVCNFTWYVYKDSNFVTQSDRSRNGTFRYKFGSSGNYRVVVRVCRGQGDSDCAFDAEDISVN